jgi:hypothetical protein
MLTLQKFTRQPFQHETKMTNEVGSEVCELAASDKTIEEL